MKKTMLSFVLVVTMVGSLMAQADGKSIGIRLGYPLEISFQTGLSNSNRIELGLGGRRYGYGINSNYYQLSVSGVYQWVWDLSS